MRVDELRTESMAAKSNRMHVHSHNVVLPHVVPYVSLCVFELVCANVYACGDMYTNVVLMKVFACIRVC